MDSVQEIGFAMIVGILAWFTLYGIHRGRRKTNQVYRQRAFNRHCDQAIGLSKQGRH